MNPDLMKMNTDLIDAAAKGKFDVVKTLLEKGAEPNLLKAADERNLQVIDNLLAHGVDPNAEKFKGWKDKLISIKGFGRSKDEVLYNAVVLGYLNIVKVFLADGADPNAPFGALMQAAFLGRIDILKALLDHGAHPNGCGDRGALPPLVAAAAEGRHEIVQILLDKGADPNIPGREDSYGVFGPTALEEAAEKGHLDVVKTLLEKGAKPDFTGMGKEYPCTALHRAAKKGHLDVVNTLLEHRADPKFSIGLRCTALHHAAEEGHHEIVKTLLAQGVDVNSLDLARAVSSPVAVAAENGHHEIVQTLLDNGADPDRCGYEPPLVTAVMAGAEAAKEDRQGYHEIVQAFLTHGADPNKSGKEDDQYAPLWEAADKGDLDSVKILLACGADPNGGALVLAANHGHYDVVRTLLKNGADPNGLVGMETPLCAAAEWSASEKGNLSIVESLLTHWADPNREECKGWKDKLKSNDREKIKNFIPPPRQPKVLKALCRTVLRARLAENLKAGKKRKPLKLAIDALPLPKELKEYVFNPLSL